MVQENKRYVNDMTHLLGANDDDEGVDYKYTISVPKAENYFPVMRYKCSSELRPVPIVSHVQDVEIAASTFILLTTPAFSTL